MRLCPRSWDPLGGRKGLRLLLIRSAVHLSTLMEQFSCHISVQLRAKGSFPKPPTYCPVCRRHQDRTTVLAMRIDPTSRHSVTTKRLICRKVATCFARCRISRPRRIGSAGTDIGFVCSKYRHLRSLRHILRSALGGPRLSGCVPHLAGRVLHNVEVIAASPTTTHHVRTGPNLPLPVRA
jgi:hypothetical protein